MLAVMRILAISALVSIVGQAGATEVYTWVDETGQIHYSDMWVEGCEKMELPDSSVASAPVKPSSSVASSGLESPDTKVPEEPIYKNIKIVSPEEDECLRRIGGIVKILVDVEPAPQKGKFLQDPAHRLLVSLNQKPLDSDFLIGIQDGSLALFLTEVVRGSHQLQVAIEDGDDDRLAQSQAVNFHVQQFSPIIRQQQREQLRKQRQQTTSPPST